jgi:hypothetical protein
MQSLRWSRHCGHDPYTNDAWPQPCYAGYADGMLDEPEFFIRKAIGWVLREMGMRRPQEVFERLAHRTARVSGVTIREAVKYLDPDRRDELLNAFREKRNARSL